MKSLPARVAATYERALNSQHGPGEAVTLRRGATDYPGVMAWVDGIKTSDLSGAVQQIERTVIVLASTVSASGFPLPIQPKQDRFVWNGKALAIMAVDEGTHRYQGVTVAYEIMVSGA